MVNLQNGTHVFGSNDHGKTWFITESPLSVGDESKIVQLNDGSWLVNSRANNKGIRYSHISKNQGKSWTTKPEIKLADPGCNASLVKYLCNLPFGVYRMLSIPPILDKLLKF